MQKDAIISGLWLIDRLLERLGAADNKSPTGNKVFSLKNKLPKELFHALLEVNDSRSAYFHGMLYSDIVKLANNIDDCIWSLEKFACDQQTDSSQISPYSPTGIHFVDFVEHPLPNTRPDYIHLFNKNDASLTLAGCRIEIWDFIQGCLIIKHKFSDEGTFDSGEHLLIALSSPKTGDFYKENSCDWFKSPHWWICIGGQNLNSQQRAAPILFLRFLDQYNIPRATMKIERRCE